MRKQPARNSFYEELDDREGLIARPGTFFYAPILYDPRVVATMRPAVDATGKLILRKGRLTFEVAYKDNLPVDTFSHPAGFAGVVGPDQELVAITGKLRPVIILSMLDANGEKALAAPSFKLSNYEPDEIAAIRAGQSLVHFHLPEDPALNILESVLEFQKIQPIMIGTRFTNPGNRRVGSDKRRYVRLADDAHAKLKDALREYLDLLP